MSYEDISEDIHYSQEFSDEEDFMNVVEETEYGEIEEDLPVFDPGFIGSSDYSRVGGTELEGKKMFETPWDVSIKRIRVIMGEPVYSDITKNIKDRAYKFIENIPEKKMILYNEEILVAAAIVLTIGGAPKSGIEKLLKETGGLKNVNHLDLVRYIRMLK